MKKFEELKKEEYDKKYIRSAKFEFIERILFYLIPTAEQRTKWLKKKNKFAYFGDHIHYQPRKYPTDAKRLKIHNNVAIAAGVEFTLHDIIHFVYNGEEGKKVFEEYRGCIEIFENVFIGAGTRILPNVRIGANSIIAAGSLITKDVPENSIVGGVPAKVIGKYEDLKNKRKEYNQKVKGIKREELDKILWKDFYRERKKEE